MWLHLFHFWLKIAQKSFVRRTSLLAKMLSWRILGLLRIFHALLANILGLVTITIAVTAVLNGRGCKLV